MMCNYAKYINQIYILDVIKMPEEHANISKIT